MSLINCPCCENGVSEDADSCPHCGHPIARGFFGGGRKERHLNILYLIIILLFALGTGLDDYFKQLLEKLN